MLEIHKNTVIWLQNKIGEIDNDTAYLFVTMKDFVRAEFKFHEIQDIVLHLNEIIETLNKKGYHVEIERLPPDNLGELKRSYDIWYEKIYGQ